MAKRRKKKKAILSSILKYEIYGIILITLSVIALSGEATVGWSLSKMFGLILGKFYFVVPLVGIYYGLMAMINRKWPNRWNSRKSGVLLLVLAFTLMASISSLEQKLAPISNLSSGTIFSQAKLDLHGELLTPSIDNKNSMMDKDIGGGYVGAIQYSALFWLFGNMGAKLLRIVMFIISFMLITNLSYVELVRIVRTRVMKVGSYVHKKLSMRQHPAGNGSTKVKSIPERNRQLLPGDEDDDDFDVDILPKVKRNAPVFFQLFGGKTEKKEDSNIEVDTDDMLDDSGVIEFDKRKNRARKVVDRAQQDNKFSKDSDRALLDDELLQSEHSVTTTPIIRDFFEHVKSEGISDDDDLEEAFTGQEVADLKDAIMKSHEQVAVDQASEQGQGIGGKVPVQSGDDATSEEDVELTLVNIAPPPKPYILPPFRLLGKPNNGGKAGDQNDYMQTARKLEATLESFGVRAKVLEVVRGPAVTRYEIQPDIGVKVSRIVSLTDDIALALAAKDIRMEAPIPGKSAIGIEVPNNEVSIVTMREVMETTIFQEAESKLSVAFGRDISGQTIVGNLAKMPHLLVAGATGSGKSVCINGIITSILYKAKPDEVKFLMVDPKMVELNVYNGIPHLLAPVVTNPKRASLALKKIVVEMEKRYELFSKSGTRNIEGYNKLMQSNLPAVLPYIVVIVDELADLMMVAANDVEEAITRLAQMARAAGIHLIIATQRPSVDVITGVIKANIPSRIAFGVSSNVDSRTILDMAGAEKLLGRGDMLFMPMGSSKPIRVQGAYLTDQEVENIVDFVRDQGQAEYDESLVPEIDESATNDGEVLDELYDQAVQVILEAKQASVSLLQRRMRVGYTRAARLIDSMEARGVIGPYEGSKPREVLVSMEQYQQNRISS
ncbi:FtsK/SpoIIIE family DNA translocase [Paenibacillus crassostreae]|uniref:Cell division protein FtsK n=1 Tax=Paenibacillus crassostreae TaxID=1763538 RepID=A0A167FLE9_9BACL|nr:DNA translocase FtsK [Paenibacillus crassostreae]AOZ94281.1 cell division protein FtsK [Paenibacillus crassostreae]OAB76683.1 cell division protein FtsK [Paenibacillus crassostreae]